MKVRTGFKRGQIPPLGCVLLGMFALGCHTIHPPSTIHGQIRAGVSEGDIPVRLDASEEFATFESRDRGHPLADPQKYVLGPGLVNYTQHYLDRAFTLVPETASAGQRAAWKYTIAPEVTSFDNTVKFGASVQILSLGLQATILDREGNQVATVRSDVEEARSITMLETAGSSAPFFGEVMELAVADLVQSLYEEISVREGRTPGALPLAEPAGPQACDGPWPSGARAPKIEKADLRRYRQVVVCDFSVELQDEDRSSQHVRRIVARTGAGFADKIARQLRKGQAFDEVRRHGPGGPDVLVVTGTLTQLDPGNAALRFLVGLGAGASGLEGVVEGRDGETGFLLGEVELDHSSYILGGVIGAEMDLESHLDAASYSVAKKVAKGRGR